MHSNFVHVQCIRLMAFIVKILGRRRRWKDEWWWWWWWRYNGKWGDKTHVKCCVFIIIMVVVMTMNDDDNKCCKGKWNKSFIPFEIDGAKWKPSFLVTLPAAETKVPISDSLLKSKQACRHSVCSFIHIFMSTLLVPTLTFFGWKCCLMTRASKLPVKIAFRKFSFSSLPLPMFQ